MRPCLALVLLFTGSCGGDSSSSTYGTCDLRSIRGSCIESTGKSSSIRNQEEGCNDAGGSWSESACPATADRIGCCEYYTFGLEFRECWYTGTTVADPPGACDSVDGAWTDG